MYKQKITLSIIIVVFFAFQACNQGAEDKTEEGSTQSELPAVLQTGTTQVNLSEYDFPFSLIIPDSSRGALEILPTSYGQTELRVGDLYRVTIAEGGDVNAFKDQLSKDLMYTNTVLESGEDFVLYKSEITGSFVEPVYHFYAVKKVGDRAYEIRDFSEDGGYAESIARFMLESVNHLIPN